VQESGGPGGVGAGGGKVAAAQFGGGQIGVAEYAAAPDDAIKRLTAVRSLESARTRQQTDWQQDERKDPIRHSVSGSASWLVDWWARQVAGCGHCARPVGLRGRIDHRRPPAAASRTPPTPNPTGCCWCGAGTGARRRAVVPQSSASGAGSRVSRSRSSNATTSSSRSFNDSVEEFDRYGKCGGCPEGRLS
jgi:hypothetical protein